MNVYVTHYGNIWVSKYSELGLTSNNHYKLNLRLIKKLEIFVLSSRQCDEREDTRYLDSQR